MSAPRGLLGVIPARGGSKGLPGKNVRPFAGLPLIAHTILFAKLCPEITRTIVSTDSPDIADVAKSFGAEVPWLRPAELSRDDSPLWPALRHALARMEEDEGVRYDAVLLLDPTSPAREPEDVSGALRRLEACPEVDGVVFVKSHVPLLPGQFVPVRISDTYEYDLVGTVERYQI